jgi:hypothetical protein
VRGGERERMRESVSANVSADVGDSVSKIKSASVSKIKSESETERGLSASIWGAQEAHIMSGQGT